MVRIWRLPPVSGFDDGQDRRADRWWQRWPGLDHGFQIGDDWGVFAVNCTGFRTDDLKWSSAMIQQRIQQVERQVGTARSRIIV